MTITTKRLIIKPFTIDLINAALTQDKNVYKKIDIIPNKEWPEPDLQEAMDYFRTELLRNGVTGFGSWIILNEAKEIIGSIGFLGEPVNGVVEIGFGIIPSKRKNGFCEESIHALCNWAIKSTNVQTIIAHCNTENIASKNVLIKCGFLITNETNGLIEFEYKKIHLTTASTWTKQL